VAWLHETVAALEVPPLAAVGLRPAQYPEVAEKAARSNSMQGNPVRLTPEELVGVLHAAS
jgi:alcohol dehydrogenase class IV